MKRIVLALAVVGLSIPSAFAAPWMFERAIDVSPAPNGQAKVFHHLDSSGRRNLAAAGDGVVIAWEDDRDGSPRVYLAYKRNDEEAFPKPLRISGNGEAYEPSLIALDDSRIAVAWEEAEQVWARLVRFGEQPALGPVHRLSRERGAQVSLAGERSGLVAVWSERSARYGRIRAQRLEVDGLSLQPGAGCPVDRAPPTDEQLYPAAELLRERLVVAWEDRRPKHTIIMASVEQPPGSCEFEGPARISEKPKGRDLPYGAGHGVSRVALGPFGGDALFAAWADKRDFRNGYDIWGAFFHAGDAGFGKNEPVQDDFGGLAKQRHATVAGHEDGTLVVAWDDDREGNPDLMLSWREDGDWSDDWPLPLASGPGWQSNPSIVLDAAGDLHAAWVERDRLGGATRLRYAHGRRLAE